MSFTVKNRYSASALHFALSLVIFSLFVFILLYHWFPEPYFSTNGGWQGLQIVAAVDLILGPLLTLIIYNTNKSRKELTLDISFIAVLQLAALFWGVSTVYTQRPLAVTFWQGKFYSISAEHFPANDIGLEVLKQYGDSYPVYIFIEHPTTEEGKKIYLKKIFQSIPPNLQPELYRPLSEHYQDIFEHSVKISQLMEESPDTKLEINNILKKTNTKLEHNYYIPLRSISNSSDVLLVFNKRNELIGYTTTPFKNVSPNNNVVIEAE